MQANRFKNITAFFCLFFLGNGFGFRINAQTVIEAPSTMDFAGMKLELSESVRKQVETQANALMINNRFFRLKIERSDAYMHIVERIFLEEGLPDDFKYLVIQESGLISDAVSSSNAVGFWQFKKTTGLEVGLIINEQMDERMNIVASSRGAARYLKRMNFSMRNWVYALLSYYAGLGGARQIVDHQYIGVQDYMPLDEKTHWYIIKFLAHKLAFEPVLNRNPALPLKVLEYADCQGRSLEQIAAHTNVPLEEIQLYNKWLKNGQIPTDKAYTVLLPVKAEDQPGMLAIIGRPGMPMPDLKPWEEKSGFLGLGGKKEPENQGNEQTQENMPVASDKTGAIYRSQAPLFFSWNGIKAIQARDQDNIAKLALQADIDKEDFLEYNDMRIFDLIVQGQVYYIKSKRRKAKVPFHTVQEGQTLWEVSQNYGITMKALLKKNRMTKPEKLKAGRILWMRKTRPSDTPVEYADPAPTLIPTAPLIMERPQAVVVPLAATTPRANVVSDSVQQAQEIAEDEADTSKVDIFISGQTKKSASPATPAPIPVPTSKAIVLAADTLKPIAPTQTNIDKETKILTARPVLQAASKMQDSIVIGNKTKLIEHKIEFGQTMYQISRLYKVRTDSLLAWNKEISPASLRAGNILIVKTSQNKAVDNGLSLAMPSPALPKPKIIASEQGAIQDFKTYRVRQGDTLFKIARENNVSVQQLQEWNNKANLSLSEGEQIRVK